MIMFSKLVITSCVKRHLSLQTCSNVSQKLSNQVQSSNLFRVCSVNYSKKRKETKQSRWSFGSNSTVFSSLIKLKKNVKNTLSYSKQFSAHKFVDKAPESVKPYLQLIRADKPIGTILLYFPCAFGISFAATPGELPDLYYLGLFGVGAFLMRGAGCIINDLWDKDIDKEVERTKSRPLASSAISTNNAIKLLFGHLTLSLGILLSLNTTCIAIGFASMIPVIAYPLAKRYTYYPQLVLGLTFNIGAVMGYAAVAGTIDWSVVAPLYGSCIAWTIYYDSIYAFQDADDDKRIGVKSTALLFSKYSSEQLREMDLSKRIEQEKGTKINIQAFLISASMAHLGLFALCGSHSHMSPIFLISMLCAFFRTFDEVSNFQHSCRESCWVAFNNTKWHGLILLSGVALTTYMKAM